VRRVIPLWVVDFSLSPLLSLLRYPLEIFLAVFRSRGAVRPACEGSIEGSQPRDIGEKRKPTKTKIMKMKRSPRAYSSSLYRKPLSGHCLEDKNGQLFPLIFHRIESNERKATRRVWFPSCDEYSQGSNSLPSLHTGRARAFIK